MSNPDPKVHRFKINGYGNRQALVIAFAESNYKVWIEKEQRMLNPDYFVCVEEK